MQIAISHDRYREDGRNGGSGLVHTVFIGMASAADDSITLEPLPDSGVPGCQDAGECYNYPMLTVEPSTVVTFSNTGKVPHTMISDTISGGPDGKFDSSLVLAGGEYTFGLRDKGTYDYYCIIHPWMAGKIVVEKGTEDTTAALEERIRMLEAKVVYLEGVVEMLLAGQQLQVTTEQEQFNATAVIHSALVEKFIENLNNGNSTSDE